ncbi:hypothetical protein XENTR_v10008900 [Xenopus tropicalis]|nr:hypothetical protein XENTR_v10008900 [Xenopus tropicalis]
MLQNPLSQLAAIVMEAAESLIENLISLKDEVSRTSKSHASEAKMPELGKNDMHLETTQNEHNSTHLEMTGNPNPSATEKAARGKEKCSKEDQSLQNPGTKNSGEGDGPEAAQDSTEGITREVSWELHPDCSKGCSHARLWESDQNTVNNFTTEQQGGSQTNEIEHTHTQKEEEGESCHMIKKEQTTYDLSVEISKSNDDHKQVLTTIQGSKESKEKGCLTLKEYEETHATTTQLLNNLSEERVIDEGPSDTLAMSFLEAAENLIGGLIPGQEEIGLSSVRRVVVIVTDRAVVDGDFLSSQEMSEESGTASTQEVSSSGESQAPFLPKENCGKNDTSLIPATNEVENPWELHTDCLLSGNHSHILDKGHSVEPCVGEPNEGGQTPAQIIDGVENRNCDKADCISKVQPTNLVSQYRDGSQCKEDDSDPHLHNECKTMRDRQHNDEEQETETCEQNENSDSRRKTISEDVGLSAQKVDIKERRKTLVHKEDGNSQDGSLIPIKQKNTDESPQHTTTNQYGKIDCKAEGDGEKEDYAKHETKQEERLSTGIKSDETKHKNLKGGQASVSQERRQHSMPEDQTNTWRVQESTFREQLKKGRSWEGTAERHKNVSINDGQQELKIDLPIKEQGHILKEKEEHSAILEERKQSTRRKEDNATITDKEGSCHALTDDYSAQYNDIPVAHIEGNQSAFKQVGEESADIGKDHPQLNHGNQQPAKITRENTESPDDLATAVLEATESLIGGLLSLKDKVGRASERQKRKKSSNRDEQPAPKEKVTLEVGHSILQSSQELAAFYAVSSSFEQCKTALSARSALQSEASGQNNMEVQPGQIVQKVTENNEECKSLKNRWKSLTEQHLRKLYMLEALSSKTIHMQMEEGPASEVLYNKKEQMGETVQSMLDQSFSRDGTMNHAGNTTSEKKENESEVLGNSKYFAVHMQNAFNRDDAMVERPEICLNTDLAKQIQGKAKSVSELKDKSCQDKEPGIYGDEFEEVKEAKEDVPENAEAGEMGVEHQDTESLTSLNNLSNISRELSRESQPSCSMSVSHSHVWAKEAIGHPQNKWKSIVMNKIKEKVLSEYHLRKTHEIIACQDEIKWQQNSNNDGINQDKEAEKVTGESNLGEPNACAVKKAKMVFENLEGEKCDKSMSKAQRDSAEKRSPCTGRTGNLLAEKSDKEHSKKEKSSEGIIKEEWITSDKKDTNREKKGSESNLSGCNEPLTFSKHYMEVRENRQEDWHNADEHNRKGMVVEGYEGKEEIKEISEEDSKTFHDHLSETLSTYNSAKETVEEKQRDSSDISQGRSSWHKIWQATSQKLALAAIGDQFPNTFLNQMTHLPANGTLMRKEAHLSHPLHTYEQQSAVFGRAYPQDKAILRSFEKHGQQQGAVGGFTTRACSLPSSQSVLQREKVFIHLSVREQETMKRLTDLQREAEIKCASDRRRQMLRFQERLSIARNRKSEEDLLAASQKGSPQLSPEPLPQGDAEQQKTAVKEHLQKMKRERTYIMQTKRDRNTTSFRELLNPVLTKNEREDGSMGLRGAEGL